MVVAQTCKETSAELLGAALGFHRAGDTGRAELTYRQILDTERNHAETWFCLGLLCQAEARLEECIACYEQAVRLAPNLAEAHNNLGIALQAHGKRHEAIGHFRRALQIKPDYQQALLNLGATLVALGEFQEAVASCTEAVRIRPNNPNAHNNLGLALAGLGKWHEALASYDQALRLQPDCAEVHCHKGIALAYQGNLEAAMDSFQEALRLNGDYADALCNLGCVYLRVGQSDQAVVCFEKAVRLQPNNAEAHFRLGVGLAELDLLAEAIGCYEQALRLKPNYGDALNNLANAYKDQGRLDEAIACYRKGAGVKGDDAALHSNLLYCLHFHPRHEPHAIYEEHQRWAQRHAEALAGTTSAHAVDRGRERRLRIGYVSPDFREHVMGFYIEPVLAAHDRERFEITCYAHVPRPDARTHRIQTSAERWRSLLGLSDAQAAELIRQDRIDILVDLAGHTGGNRLLVFARKPAPVQATHFAYPDTTGLRTIDYRITDPFSDPPGMTERYHTEKLIRLPEICWCYQPGVNLEVVPIPARESGRVTFGSLNTLAKLTPEVIALWSRVLTVMPDARIHLLTGAGSEGDCRVLEMFARNGIRGERITLLGRRPRPEYFKLYQAIDICLDPFPFNGCNTSADALWMGVPVIMLAGKTYVSRQGVSLLSHLGLPELIAATPEDYVQIATRLASDLDRLQALRSGLRERMCRSTLMNPLRFTRQLEQAYRQMWQTWCRSE